MVYVGSDQDEGYDGLLMGVVDMEVRFEVDEVECKEVWYVEVMVVVDIVQVWEQV